MQRFSWVVALLLLCGWVRADESDPAIRQAIDSYVAAFNRADAVALADHFSPTGELVLADGLRLVGRVEIEKHFGKAFARDAKSKLELDGTNVELLAPSVAIETGSARLVSPDGTVDDSTYKAVHVKTSAGWKLDSVREEDAPTPAPTHYAELQSLEWMVGSWQDKDASIDVESSCRWSTNRNFLVQSYKVVAGEKVDFEGTHIIGWDPALKVIRSWLFDSDGGFGAGRWTNEGNRWKVQMLHVLPDGRRGSAMQVYDLIDERTLVFRSVGRQVEGEVLPSLGPVTLLRAEPTPQ